MILAGVGRRYYAAQLERHQSSPAAGDHQLSPGPVMRGRSAGDLVRPAYLPQTSDVSQPMYTYQRDPMPFGYDRRVDDRQVCLVI